MRPVATRAGALLLASLVAGAPSSNAQTLRGRLLGEGSDAPIIGALITLEDAAGVSVGQVVSGSAGRFQLRAPGAGTFTLRVLRIGFAPWTASLPLESGQTLDRLFTLADDVRVVLPEITIDRQRLCGALVRADSLSAVLWDQARTALELTNLSVASRGFRFRTVLFERTLDSTRTRTVDLPATEINIRVTEWPVRSPPYDSVLAFGFVQNREDLVVGPTWYGPDAEFLLSEAFFAGHCFQVVPPAPDLPAEWLGLSFDPGTTSQRADIRGVLWLDRGTAQLRRLGFEYTRLPSWARGRDGFGWLEFAPLPVGGWIVQRWLLRVPVPLVDIARVSPRFLEYRESGGFVSQVLTADGQEVVRYLE